jgi:hypothetical protein
MGVTEQLPLRRWTLDEFDQMSHVGILSPGGYELLDGLIYDTNGYVRRWSVRDYDLMAEAGLITEDEHAELIDGYVFRPIGFKWKRAHVRMLLGAFLHPVAREFGIVSQVGHLALDDGTMVHPAVKVLHGRASFYEDRYPGADDVLLVIEVRNPLASHHLEVKRGLYARHVLPEYWLIDPDRRAILVHLAPKAGDYSDVREITDGQPFASPALRGYEVRVEDVLGPAAHG